MAFPPPTHAQTTGGTFLFLYFFGGGGWGPIEPSFKKNESSLYLSGEQRSAKICSTAVSTSSRNEHVSTSFSNAVN